MPILITDIIKFIHLLLTLSILGSVFYCFALLCSPGFKTKRSERRQTIFRLNKILLLLGFFAALTGTLLVYPKHFTFHTPWIQAAYVLISLFILLIAFMFFFRKKKNIQLGFGLLYFILLVLLIGVVHDAVTKFTFLHL